MLIAVLVIAVLVLFAQLVMLALLGVLLWRVKSALAVQSEASAELKLAIAGLPQIAEGMGDLKEVARSVPILLTGLTNVAKENTAAMVEHRRITLELKNLMFSGSPSPTGRTLEDDVESIMQENPEIEIDEARYRADEEKKIKGLRFTK